jgi:putative chitinase
MTQFEIAQKLCQRARQCYLDAIENGDALFEQHRITTPERIAHFLAQAFHETGGLMIEWESGAYSANRLVQIFGEGHHSAAVTPDEAKALAYNGPAIFERVYGLGNPKKAAELGNLWPGDGYKYRGGGILQTTGRANYRRMGQKCGVDFEANPNLIISADHALKPALAEWTEGNLNAFADKDDILTITKRINGGLNGLEDRKWWLGKIRQLQEN